MDLKVIAIKPLKKCSSTLCKVLKRGQEYYLYNNYSIAGNSIEERKGSVPENLYQLPRGGRVFVSAIVGRNGSGKSTIIELLYALAYNAACRFGVFDNNAKPIRGLYAAVYYKKGQNFYCLKCEGAAVSLFVQTPIDAEFQEVKTDDLGTNVLRHLFYTIAMNYSHHSLNSGQTGNGWLSLLFHKNDGYQTPIVINPFREEGNIDINNERDLTLSRLVTLLLTVQSENKTLFNELLPGKKATHIHFKLNKKKIEFSKEYESELRKIMLKHRRDILDVVFNYFPVGEKPIVYSRDETLQVAYLYIIKKLYNITSLYKPYQSPKFKFINRHNEWRPSPDSEFFFDPVALKRLLSKMKNNPSHITLKFRQSINFIANFKFYGDKLERWVKIADLAEGLGRLTSNTKQELIEFIPPSFFTVDIKFETNGTLRDLSSGEKQSIFSSTSWVYHILNLNSVREDEEANYIRHNNINIIFDEIELYYHPEMQRTFLREFLNTLSRIPLKKNIGINCIFITHSPFILSDIPNENILFLDQDGTPNELANERRTFGANIHELLKNHFLLKNGAIGAFAQFRIDSLIQYLKSKEEEDSYWDMSLADSFIELISEPVIRAGVRSMYIAKINSEESRIKSQIESLERELKRIQKNEGNTRN